MRNSLPTKKYSIDPYDIFIILLTGVSLLSLIILAVPYFDSTAQQIALALDMVISILFMLDFFYRLLNSMDKKEYLKWGWLDLLGSLPFLPLLRILRIFRAIRSLRILQNNSLREIGHAIGNRPERTTFFAIILFSIILVSLSSYAIFYTEQLSPTRNIQNASDALWWAIVTVTTVGYGDKFPTTNGGRIVAIMLMFTGIGIFSAMTSYLSTLFINRHESQKDQITKEHNEIVLQRLAAIEDQLRELSDKHDVDNEQKE